MESPQFPEEIKLEKAHTHDLSEMSRVSLFSKEKESPSSDNANSLSINLQHFSKKLEIKASPTAVSSLSPLRALRRHTLKNPSPLVQLTQKYNNDTSSAIAYFSLD